MTTEPIIIPLHKGKLVSFLLGTAFLTIIGIWVLLFDRDINSSLKYGVGLPVTLFFGAIAITYFIKYRSNKPGIVIDDNGITDNASGVSAGFIPWADVKRIYISNVATQEFVMIEVSNPKHYITRQPNLLKRMMMWANWKSWGTPITITANGLQTFTPVLVEILEDKWAEYKNNGRHEH